MFEEHNMRLVAWSGSEGLGPRGIKLATFPEYNIIIVPLA